MFVKKNLYKIEKMLIFCYFKTITGSSNGRTSDSESEYLGSNPSPVAQKKRCLFPEEEDWQRRWSEYHQMKELRMEI